MWEDDGDVVNPAGGKGGKPKAKAKGKAAAKPQTQSANPQDENMDDGSGTGSGSESGSEDEVQEDDQGGGDDHGKKKCTGFCKRKKTTDPIPGKSVRLHIVPRRRESRADKGQGAESNGVVGSAELEGEE